MNKNPANQIKDTMWTFLMDHGQKSNIPALKEYVYDLIKMTTQKDAGQRKAKENINWDELDMTLMSIVIEATALVLSGDLDQYKSNEEWVLVDEQLPEDGEAVLITYRGISGNHYVNVDEYDSECGWSSGWDEDIVAWADLPKPYMDEKRIALTEKQE